MFTFDVKAPLFVTRQWMGPVVLCVCYSKEKGTGGWSRLRADLWCFPEGEGGPKDTRMTKIFASTP